MRYQPTSEKGFNSFVLKVAQVKASVWSWLANLFELARQRLSAAISIYAYLTERTYSLVVESQFPHKIIKFLFTFTN